MAPKRAVPVDVKTCIVTLLSILLVLRDSPAHLGELGLWILWIVMALRGSTSSSVEADEAALLSIYLITVAGLVSLNKLGL